MKTSTNLESMLRDMDRKSYPAYKALRGSYRFGTYILSVDHVQGDPFAAPSRLTVHITDKASGFSSELWSSPDRKTAFCDFLLRQFAVAVRKYSFQAKGSGKSGALFTTQPGQEVLSRTACTIDRDGHTILMRFEAGFPANGRTINSRELHKILFDYLPSVVSDSLYSKHTDQKALQAALELYEDQQALRVLLSEHELAAFVADGAILPRKTGVANTPLKEAVPFRSPDSMRLTLSLPHRGKISGMGIRKGITLIVGGGYHGKSTLLKALEAGVYNHIAGDGREFVITDSTAVKLRAEEGRIVKRVDISPFINHLPNGKDTGCFSTEDASGSTSQAAGVMEGIEAGTKLFLIDEDTCATNFMVRDALMQRVIAPDKEPITPFLDRIRPLFSGLGISTILVVGSSGAFFHIADRIIQMDSYRTVDITEEAKKEAAHFPSSSSEFDFSGGPAPRTLRFSFKRREDNRSPKIRVQSKDVLTYDRETIDLRYVEQLADEEQTRALGYLLQYLVEHPQSASMAEQLTFLYQKLLTEGLESIVSSDCPPFMALPRLQEVFACVNRCRF
ncbi:MAG: ABC-ATPase domain-containing protein [Lachnospiraceae bacterium]|nr:ABC-ATPase domain-containing protein [Lachnospiraceae bacterium]